MTGWIVARFGNSMRNIPVRVTALKLSHSYPVAINYNCYNFNNKILRKRAKKGFRKTNYPLDHKKLESKNQGVLHKINFLKWSILLLDRAIISCSGKHFRLIPYCPFGQFLPYKNKSLLVKEFVVTCSEKLNRRNVYCFLQNVTNIWLNLSFQLPKTSI